MSERQWKILILVMLSFAEFGIGVFSGWKEGKHSADRWYAAHPMNGVTGFAIYRDNELVRVQPKYEVTMPPDTWKYSDGVDWEDSPEWKAHQKRLREANPLKKWKPEIMTLPTVECPPSDLVTCFGPHPLNGTMKGGDCKSTERGPVCGNYQGAHPLKLGKRSRKEAPNVSWEPGDGPAAKTYTYAYHDCEDSKPQGDYPGHVDWTTCFDRETNKVRYQQRILTAPLMCGGADGGHPCVVPTPQVPQK